jgi:ribulose-bisphosphate carboxylase large chain
MSRAEINAMVFPRESLKLSGERFSVTYRILGDEAEALAKAKETCLEETVELPDAVVPDGDIRDQIVGRIESFGTAGEGLREAVISYAVETAGVELTQLLNVVFGNVSIKPGIRAERLDLPEGLLRVYRGPRFGRQGLRAVMGVSGRPLLCTALKPLGLSPDGFGSLAYRLALGGIDVIKDDHGLADQTFAPFDERVARCVEAVERANRETGMKCIYAPNVTGPSDRVMERTRAARSAGVGAILVSPGLVGLDAMRCLADDERVGLPILSHPTFQGSLVTCPDNGISHFALYGQINRLAGADVAIFPNWGGRFSFSMEECKSIAEGTAMPMGDIRPIFPAPGGGMSLARVPEMLEVYGQDVIFLIGGGLFGHGPDLVDNCRYFRKMVDVN